MAINNLPTSQVRAAEISITKSYGAKLTLRFPRVEMIRDDKSWQDILTTDELKKLREAAGGKITADHYRDDGTSDEPSPKKGPGAKQFTQSISLASHSKPADLSDVKKSGSFLKGKEICVLESEASHSKQELEKLVASCGGSLTQNPRNTTYCIVCNKLTVRSRNFKTKYNIIKPAWLLSCKKSNKLLPWGPLDVVSVLPEYSDGMSRYYDKYGDSFVEPCDTEDLHRIIDNMDETKVSAEDRNNLMEDMDEFNESYNIFSKVVALIVDKNGVSIKNDLVRQQVLLYGGKVVGDISGEVTHVIHTGEFLADRSLFDSNIKIVSTCWLDEMIAGVS